MATKKTQNDDSFNRLITEISHTNQHLRQLVSLGGMLGGLEHAIKYQTPFLRLNMQASEHLNTSLLKNSPAIVNLQTQIGLLESGLEDNTDGLGKYIARAVLLGENQEELIKGIQTLRLNLGLSIKEENSLTKTLMDASKNYNTASTKVVQGLANFSDALAVFSYTNNFAAIKGVAEVMAMTERRAPGGLQAVLGPLLEGPQGFSRAAMLGVEGQIQQLQRGQGRASDIIISILKTIDQKARIFDNLDTRIARTMVKESFGMDAAVLGINKKMLDAIERGPNNLEKLEASLSDANGSLEKLQQILHEPIALGINTMIGAVERIAGRLTPEEMGKAVLGFTGAVFSLFAVKAVQLLSRGIVGGLPGFLLTTGIGAALGIALEGVTTSTRETAESTKSLAKIAKKDSEDISPAEYLNRLHGSTLNKLISENSKYSMSSAMSEEESKLQRERLIQKLGELLEEIKKQTTEKKMRPSRFKNE